MAMRKGKPISFRPSDEINAILTEYISQHPNIKKDSQAVVTIIKAFPNLLSQIQQLKTRLEKGISPKTTKIFHYLPRMEKTPQCIEKEVKRLFRGQHSKLIEALCNMTKESVSRSMTIATKRGIIIAIPTHNP